MWYLQEFFLKNGFVTAVHPHRDTDTKGRWNLLIHKDNYKKGIIDARDILSNYDTLVPDTTDVRATWSIPRSIGNGVTLDGDSSNGEQTYASLSMASLVSVLTQEDYEMPVTTTNTAIDLTIREVSIPLPGVSTIPSTNNPPTYSQVLQSSFQPSQTTPTASETAAQLEITRLQNENKRLQSLVDATSSTASATTLSSFSQPVKYAESTTTSTITNSVSMDQFNELSSKYDNILLLLQSLQMQKDTSSNASYMDITTTAKHGQQDASSLADQPDSKRMDSKQTPNKSHPPADATMHQSP
jgi:hypothetical protein